jgi:hypothetical protein
MNQPIKQSFYDQPIKRAKDENMMRKGRRQGERQCVIVNELMIQSINQSIWNWLLIERKNYMSPDHCQG